VCDADLLGRTLKEDKFAFHVSEKFYKGSLVSLEEAVELVWQCNVVNMVGRTIVKKALEKGLVHPDAVLEINGIPHAQIVKL
jgi:hypothetical protein